MGDLAKCNKTRRKTCHFGLYKDYGSIRRDQHRSTNHERKKLMSWALSKLKISTLKSSQCGR